MKAGERAFTQKSFVYEGVGRRTIRKSGSSEGSGNRGIYCLEVYLQEAEVLQ